MKRVIAVSNEINKYLCNISYQLNFVLKEGYFDEFIHTYGVAYLASILAIRRGLDPELACIAGLLHDCGRIIHNIQDHTHGPIGAKEAQQILKNTNLFNDAEINLICSAVRCHSEKKKIGSEYEELLKDADVFERLLMAGEMCEELSNKRK